VTSTSSSSLSTPIPTNVSKDGKLSEITSASDNDALRQLQNKEGLTKGAYQQQYLRNLDWRYKKGKSPFFISLISLLLMTEAWNEQIGEITLSELKESQAAVHSITSGADPHRVVGLLPAIRRAYSSRRDISLRLCDSFDFYYRSGGDGGWGCGLKNTQTMCSSLIRHPVLSPTLFDGQGIIPSIPVLQASIDYAHAAGYDPTGAAQLGKLVGTTKWIGALEVAALLRSFGIMARVVNFLLDKNNTDHTALMKWVWDFYAPNANVVNNDRSPTTSSSTSVLTNGTTRTGGNGSISSYFNASSSSSSSKPMAMSSTSTSSNTRASSQPTTTRICPPIYFQHEGHSRTIIGAAMNTKTNKIELVVLDPDLTGGAPNLLVIFAFAHYFHLVLLCTFLFPTPNSQ
jgi:hypothetical protein